MERIRSEFKWLAYASIFLIVAGITLGLVGMFVVPGALLIVGVVVGVTGVVLFQWYFREEKKTANRTLKAIPKKLRDDVWRKRMGGRKNGYCYACRVKLTDLNFEVGHNNPRSKGGSLNIDNLEPLCSTCNKGMGAFMTIDEWIVKLEEMGIRSSLSAWAGNGARPRSRTRNRTRKQRATTQ